MGSSANAAEAWAVSTRVAVVQMVLHYVGESGIVVGVLTLRFGNGPRGVDLLISGVGFIVLQYIVGISFVVDSKICVPHSGERTYGPIYSRAQTCPSYYRSLG